MAAKNIDQVQTIVEQISENYCSHFINHLNKMRIDRKHSLQLRTSLSDFIAFRFLLKHSKFIYVHEIALAIASPYFAAMFESQSIKESAKQYFITFIDDVQETSVGYLKLDAGIIAFTWVKEQCEKFLKKSMNSTNCFRIRKFADMHSLKDLHDYSHKYILNNFDNLINEEELLWLHFEQVCKRSKGRLEFEITYCIFLSFTKFENVKP
uniref:BTB domain-containing protein n=1 Tax=Glossina palpalis gambiensis TaxID=67801 RepID=A0A1B0BPJ6_9MUSC